MLSGEYKQMLGCVAVRPFVRPSVSLAKIPTMPPHRKHSTIQNTAHSPPTIMFPLSCGGAGGHSLGRPAALSTSQLCRKTESVFSQGLFLPSRSSGSAHWPPPRHRHVRIMGSKSPLCRAIVQRAGRLTLSFVCTSNALQFHAASSSNFPPSCLNSCSMRR